ncbi:hypothetical protein [Amycolatopsis sp. cmx-11-51]|uniref:hypothetical protein n=1 Tax=unclassified Amycolatopsis TaxID=2618356 RepID=UPI0039E51F12
MWGFLVSIVCTTLAGIYQTALCRFAADGVVPEAFGKVDSEGAFAGRRARNSMALRRTTT